jgi:hypothetical protein
LQWCAARFDLGDFFSLGDGQAVGVFRFGGFALDAGAFDGGGNRRFLCRVGIDGGIG